MARFSAVLADLDTLEGEAEVLGHGHGPLTYVVVHLWSIDVDAQVCSLLLDFSLLDPGGVCLMRKCSASR